MTLNDTIVRGLGAVAGGSRLFDEGRARRVELRDREDLNIETPIPLLTVETTVAGAVKSCESNQETINNVCLEL